MCKSWYMLLSRKGNELAFLVTYTTFAIAVMEERLVNSRHQAMYCDLLL